VLEEPPPRVLFLLLSHAPGRLWPTIRSRCRRLDLRPLGAADVARAVAATLGRDAEDREIAAAAAAAEGSVAQAQALLDGQAMAVRQAISSLLDKLPQTDPRALHALGEALSGADRTSFAGFLDLVNAWLTQRLSQIGTDTARMARVAEAWDRVNRAARDVEEYNLERKPLVFSVFALLAETARG
jgi:DNA polymerase-3 subunit delta'